MLRANGQFPQAADALRRTIALNGGYIVAYQRLNEILEQMGDLENAAKVLQQLRERSEITSEFRAELNVRIDRITKRHLDKKLAQ
jgi:tetratricopeptide (TPR) repeat protein